MSNERADYYRHLQTAGDRFLRGRGRVGPLRSLAGGRVVAVLPAENYHHLVSHHGVRLSNRDEVEWLTRKNPEVVPEQARKIRVNFQQPTANSQQPTAAGRVGLAGRRTRFGIASFSKVYPNERAA